MGVYVFIWAARVQQSEAYRCAGNYSPCSEYPISYRMKLKRDRGGRFLRPRPSVSVASPNAWIGK